MSDEKLVIFCTVPDSATAGAIARALVEERLAACVNVLDGLRSIYSWKGELCDDPELLMVIKSRRERFEPLRARLVELHPYDVPEVVALPVVAGHAPYLSWIDGCLDGNDGS